MRAAYSSWSYVLPLVGKTAVDSCPKVCGKRENVPSSCRKPHVMKLIRRPSPAPSQPKVPSLLATPPSFRQTWNWLAVRVAPASQITGEPSNWTATTSTPPSLRHSTARSSTPFTATPRTITSKYTLGRGSSSSNELSNTTAEGLPIRMRWMSPLATRILLHLPAWPSAKVSLDSQSSRRAMYTMSGSWSSPQISASGRVISAHSAIRKPEPQPASSIRSPRIVKSTESWMTASTRRAYGRVKVIQSCPDIMQTFMKFHLFTDIATDFTALIVTGWKKAKKSGRERMAISTSNQSAAGGIRTFSKESKVPMASNALKALMNL
mmetsp:Transcript_61474/g.164374  ORF Transcript_61474/g.164374 Transcript_61474/m.164374 type:complete len:322 (-) Transcript_61474:16-981(-)